MYSRSHSLNAIVHNINEDRFMKNENKTVQSTLVVIVFGAEC